MVWNALKQVWRFLTRLNVAGVIILVVLSLAALGSCFPQLSPSVAVDAERLASWEAGVRARYGPLTDLLAAIRAFRWFHSPVFLIPLALLILTTLVCTLDRWRAVWRRAFRSPMRPSDLVSDTAPHTARLTGPTSANSPGPGSAASMGMLAYDSAHMLRKCLARQGFRVRSETVEGVLYLRGDRNRLTSLATLVTHLAVVLLLVGTMLSIGYGWREELTIGPGETAEVGHGSRLALRNDDFSIARHADGGVVSYDAQIAVMAGGREVARGEVGVNQPLTYGGVGFYLSGYGERESGYSVTLLAVHDPGYGLVIAAGFLLLLGLTVSFNFPRCWIQARIEPDGSLDLAGWAERRAYDFGREFKALVEEFSRSAGTEGEGVD
jgi:cytochrome c biogenesis protein ResB